MPLARFICTDGDECDVEDCLEECRMQRRCLTRTTLKVIVEGSHDRKWDGVPHVTSLLNGTMQEYLKVTKEYAVAPKGMAFALLGSSHHKLLEQVEEDGLPPEIMLKTHGYLSELKLSNGWVQGTLDLVEMEDSEVTLTDHKTWGSNRLIRDREYKGEFDPNSGQVDLLEVSLQMGMYRSMLEDVHGILVDRMQVQCTVRDGGLVAATKRGVKENMYLIPVQKLPKSVVDVYFRKKAEALGMAIASDSVEACSEKESWNGHRCKSYCDVAPYCVVNS